MAERHRVIALHQVGFAPFELPQIAYDDSAFVGHLGEFIRVLGLQGVTLVGESFGGWVVASYGVAMARERNVLPAVEKLVIAAGAIGLTKPASPTARNFFDPQVQIELSERTKEYPRFDNKTTIALAMEQTGLMKGEPTEADLEGIRVPTLVLWGDRDEVVPLEIGHRLVRLITDARMVVLPNVGHIAPVERPVEFARVVAQFVQGR